MACRFIRCCWTTLAGAALAGPATAAGQGPPPSVTLPADLARVLDDYTRAWQARDTTALAALFTPDGWALPGERPPVRGTAALARHYGRGAGGSLHLRALSHATADTVGYIVGAYAAAAGAPDDGKFVLALRRSPGGPWRIAADIDNASVRRAPPAPAAVRAPVPAPALAPAP